MSRRDLQILYVSPDAQHARMAAQVLCGTHKRLLHLETGSEALAFIRKEGTYAQRHRPNLMMLDFTLPRHEGRRVLAEMKADQDLRRIPVVVMGASERTDVLEAYDAFANCYVKKPATAEEFEKVLRELGEFWFSVAKLPVA